MNNTILELANEALLGDNFALALLNDIFEENNLPRIKELDFSKNIVFTLFTKINQLHSLLSLFKNKLSSKFLGLGYFHSLNYNNDYSFLETPKLLGIKRDNNSISCYSFPLSFFNEEFVFPFNKVISSLNLL